jgi:peptidoglycan hydrolase-like protein with peptidoglycan-binding domain
VSSPGLSSIQRRLAEFGYGPVKANGIDGPETRAAIERFERARGMAPTGRVSERLKAELVSATGPL